MTVLELIQTFQVFKPGDFVVYNNKLFQITHLPCFKSSIVNIVIC